MKKSWIIVLAFVFLYSAVPAFSVPIPVPENLCLQWDTYDSDTTRLSLESKGKVAGVEHFEVTGTHISAYIFPVTGTAIRHNNRVMRQKKQIDISISGHASWDGPGDMTKVWVEIRYHLKKKKGKLSYAFDVGDITGIDTVTEVACSSLLSGLLAPGLSSQQVP